MRTRVKICGFTRPEDALQAVRLGVDAIGLVFYSKSPRNVEIAQAQAIADGLPAFVTVTGLFVDEAPERINEVLRHVRIDLLQFHGDEKPKDCVLYDKPFIKAIRMKPGIDLKGLACDYHRASGLLLDADHPEAKGGTGLSFDWARIPQGFSKPMILAGGLRPENVSLALHQVRPYALDVSSGVESSKGIKDTEKMAAFLKEVYEFDYQH